MRFLILDVFTDRPLTGNQLAVFPDGPSVPEAIRQDLAREVGFSETVYVDPPSHPVAGDARARIFTPATELPFAGHPVLGTAVALGRERSLPPGSVVTLECGVGPVPVELDGTATGGWMVQPLPEISSVANAAKVLTALGLDAGDVVTPLDRYVNGPEHLVVAVADGDRVAALTPDFGALVRAAGAAGVSTCAVTGPGAVVTRCFVPGLGVNEDPATGSAAGPVGVHLLRHGLVDPGIELTIEQGAAIQRPSVLRVRVAGTADAIESVAVGGSAVIVGEGRFDL